MDIRDEKYEDHHRVRALIEAAFGQSTEADLVDALRREGDAEIALVAIDGGEIVGHVMLSSMVAPARALGLAPVSVLPSYQGKGIGATLIQEGLRQAKARGWEAVFVVGRPEYYARFGFRTDIAKAFASPYAGPHFMALELVEGVLQGKCGKVAYAPAFAAV